MNLHHLLTSQVLGINGNTTNYLSGFSRERGAAFVLVNAYSSTIISYLTAPKLITVAKTLDQVALGYPQNLKLLIEKDNIMTGRYLVCPIQNIFFHCYKRGMR